MGAVARQLYRAVAKVVREYARAGVALPHLPTSLLSAVLPPPSLAALRATPSRQQPLADLRAAFRGVPGPRRCRHPTCGASQLADGTLSRVTEAAGGVEWGGLNSCGRH
jgi:hypothetical protein